MKAILRVDSVSKVSVDRMGAGTLTTTLTGGRTHQVSTDGLSNADITALRANKYGVVYSDGSILLLSIRDLIHLALAALDDDINNNLPLLRMVGQSVEHGGSATAAILLELGI